MAAIPGMSGQNTHITYQCHRNSLCHTRYPRDHCLLEVLGTHPIQGWKLACSSMRVIQLHSLPAYHISDRTNFYCHAATSTSDVPSSEKVNFLKLQNGSDIRGVAVEGVEGESVILTEPVTEAIGVAFAAWLLEKKNPSASKRLRVSIGHDSRISAQTLQDAISRGLATAGLEVVHYGLASTPAMFNSTISENEDFLCPVDGSIMITASHLPYNRNGFKFFTNAGGLGKTDIKDILERARNIYENSSPEELKKTVQEVFLPFKKIRYMTVYTSDLVQAVRKAAGSIEKPLEGFHIVVDAGNGAGGFFAAKVLEPLGAVTSGSQFLDPNGFFPNHIPNPEDKAAMKSIIQAVLDNQADLGIIFDTDVDSILEQLLLQTV